MIIRRYRPGEEAEIWNVYYTSTRHIVSQDYTLAQIERWAPNEYDIMNWRERIAKKDPFVALINEEIVGFAELEMDGHIDCFYCHHEFQRQGIGARLMEKIFTEANQLGLDRLFAEVSSTARDFFKAKGFKIEQETNHIVCGQPAKQYLMSKALNFDLRCSFQETPKRK